jgi:hypothetical protein
MGIVFSNRRSAIQTDFVFGIQFLDMAAMGALNFHFISRAHACGEIAATFSTESMPVLYNTMAVFKRKPGFCR